MRFSTWCGHAVFADFAWCERIRHYLRAVFGGREVPRVIVFVDNKLFGFVEISRVALGSENQGN
jgi:hypothetical protein